MPDFFSLLKKAQPPWLPLGPLITLPAPPQLKPTDENTANQRADYQPLVTLPAPPEYRPTDRGTYQSPGDRKLPIPVERDKTDAEMTPEEYDKYIRTGIRPRIQVGVQDIERDAALDQGTYQGPKQLPLMEMSPKRIAELLIGLPLSEEGGRWLSQSPHSLINQNAHFKRVYQILSSPQFEDAYAQGLKDITVEPQLLIKAYGKEMNAAGVYDRAARRVRLNATVMQRAEDRQISGELNAAEQVNERTVAHELAHHIDYIMNISDHDAVNWHQASLADYGIPRGGVYTGWQPDPHQFFTSDYARQAFEALSSQYGVREGMHEDLADFAAKWIVADPSTRRDIEKAFPNRSALLQMHLQDMIDRAQGGQSVSGQGSGGGPNTSAVRVYHGTGTYFEQFDPEKFKESGLYGPGAYVTTDPRISDSYARKAQSPPNPLPTPTTLDALYKELENTEGYIEELGGTTNPYPHLDNAQLITVLPDYDQRQREIDRRQEVANLAYLKARIASYIPPKVIPHIFLKYGQQIRPIELSDKANIFDVELPVRAGLVENIRTYLDKNDPSGRVDDYLAQSSSDYENGDALYRDLTQLGEGDKGWVNALLSHFGYDGLKYPGGMLTPMHDKNGKPIHHDAYVIFAPSLDVMHGAYELPNVRSAKFEEHPADSGTIHAATMEFAVPPTDKELQQVQQQLAEQNGWQVLQATPLDAGEKKYYFTFGTLSEKP